MINGINHIAICTSNMDRMVEFYRDLIGFTEVARGGWENDERIDSIIGLKGSAAKQVMLRAGNVYLELFQYSAPQHRPEDPLRPNDRGYTHLAIDVTGIDEEYERLTKAGIRFNRAPPELRGGKIRAIYGKDPDGNVIEMQEVFAAEVGFKFDQLPLIDASRLKKQG